jgi:AraC-like DNA-binding protein
VSHDGGAVSRASHLCLADEIVPPSGEWKPEVACWCFVKIRRGQGYWMGASAVLEIDVGDVLVLAPHRPGFFRASQLCQVDLIQFLLCPELLSGLLTLREMRQLDSAPADSTLSIRRFPGGDAVTEAFSRLDAATAPRHGLMSRIGMLQVAAVFFDRELRNPRGVNGAFLTSHQRIRALVQQLTEADVLAHAVAELAARCNCSPRHFNRLFTRLVGMSFRAKQTELRLRKACQLLLETDQSITQIAVALGYQKPALFNAQFKKRFELTPSAWRERYRSNTALPAPACS